MNTLAHSNTKHLSAQQQTAFTTILMGIFLNSPIISGDFLFGLNEDDIYSKYGDTLLYSLHAFSENPTLKQLQILHNIQR